MGEHVPFYGLVSGGALDRFPGADDEGELRYARTFDVPPEVPANLEDFAVVRHGVDLNGNGAYDSPFKVSLPANCGKVSAE